MNSNEREERGKASVKWITDASLIVAHRPLKGEKNRGRKDGEEKRRGEENRGGKEYRG